MPHMPHRSMNTKPPVAVEVETPIQKYERSLSDNLNRERQQYERHLGTTRVPKSRVLKPPVG